MALIAHIFGTALTVSICADGLQVGYCGLPIGGCATLLFVALLSKTLERK